MVARGERAQRAQPLEPIRRRMEPRRGDGTFAARSAAPCMFRKPKSGGVGRTPLGSSIPSRSKDHPTTLAPAQPEQARGTKPDSQGRAAPRVHRGPTMTSTCFVGIDVSKDSLDLHARPDGSAARYTNDPVGITALLSHVTQLAPERIVLEATGGFEAPRAAARAGAGQPVVVVNPRPVRDFAKATGKLAKTDAIDAAVLAHFAEAIRPEVRALPDAQARAWRPWSRGAGSWWRCGPPR